MAVLPRVESSYSPRNVSASFDQRTSFVRASVKATLIVHVMRYRDASCCSVRLTGGAERPTTSPVHTASDPDASEIPLYLPRPLNSLRHFSVRICSTCDKLLRFS